MPQYIIATHNPHKLAELRRILSECGIDGVTDRDLGITLTEAEENGTTFAENAYIKAASACRESGLPAIADDSGLCIDALNGRPGVLSARFAPEGERKKTVLRLMEGLEPAKRTAYFISAICCVFPDGRVITAEGRCDGHITFECRGENGFGYDPIFECANGLTYSEMSDEEKDAISHRGVGLRLFRQNLQRELFGKSDDQP